MLGLECSPRMSSVVLNAGEASITDKLCLTKRSCDALEADPDAFMYSP